MNYANPSEAVVVQRLLLTVGMRPCDAATVLEIDERTMRDYCSGAKVPRAVILALERLIDLQRQVG